MFQRSKRTRQNHQSWDIHTKWHLTKCSKITPGQISYNVARGRRRRIIAGQNARGSPVSGHLLKSLLLVNNFGTLFISRTTHASVHLDYVMTETRTYESHVTWSRNMRLGVKLALCWDMKVNCTQLNAGRRTKFAFPVYLRQNKHFSLICLTKRFSEGHTNLQLSTLQEDMQSVVDTQKEARVGLWDESCAWLRNPD